MRSGRESIFNHLQSTSIHTTRHMLLRLETYTEAFQELIVGSTLEWVVALFRLGEVSSPVHGSMSRVINRKKGI